MSKVLVISTSLRPGSNSELLAKEFEKGAKEKGHDVVFLSLKDKKIAFCHGCMACQKLGRCIIDDDANAIADLMCESEVIAFASPIYYYEMSGQMKTLIDRVNSLYSRPYKFKDIYFLCSAAEEEKEVPYRAISGLEGWIDCFEGVSLKGCVFAGGVNSPSEIKGKPYLEEAYQLGKSI